MTVALDAPVQEASNRPSPSRAARLMLFGFLVYTLLILLGHTMGFPLGYAYLHKVCSDVNMCGLTLQNVHALERHGFSIAFYAYLFMTIQAIYILVCVGIALLIVFKKPGQWVPLGVSCFLIGFSAYEGVDYPALATVYPVLYIPSQLLIGLGMGILGMYALLTFPNGQFGSRWVLGYFIFQVVEGGIAFFITNPIFIVFNNVVGITSFPIILGVLIYRYRRLLNAKERVATKWLIVSWSIFISALILFNLVLAVIPAGSFVLVLVTFGGFFGCGINITGFLMAVVYANAFDIDIFIRRTLVYTSLTAILALVYAGLVFGSQFVLAMFSAQVAGSQLVLVGSTLVIAALFHPLRRGLQHTIDRRFYRQKYNAGRVIARFSAGLRSEINLPELSERLVGVVQETMQPAHVSLWLRPSERGGKHRAPWRVDPPGSSEGR